MSDLPLAGRRLIVMIGTARDGAGGIASVISAYAAHGLFARWPIIALDSHVTGSKWHKLGAFASALTRYARLMLGGRIAMLHLHTSAGPSFWRKACFAVMAFAWRVPVIVHIHSGQFSTFYAEGCGPLRRRAVRAVLTRSARVVALSPAWRDRTLEIVPRAAVVCVPNPVIASGGRARQLGERVVIFLGKIGAEKGVEDLIQAWRLVRDRLHDARLVIAGDGALKAARERIEACGLVDCVTLPGWVSGTAKEALLSQAAVCVLPSYAEGMPVSLLEAMAAGIPCVATGVGGIPDMIADGVEGRLVAPGNVRALAEALIAVLSDERRYTAMSAAALARFEAEYAADVVMPKLEQLYEELGMCRLAV